MKNTDVDMEQEEDMTMDVDMGIFKRKQEEPESSVGIKRKKILMEEEIPALPPPPPNEQQPQNFPGFVTASGKEVKISDAAMERALALINGIVEKEDVENVPLKKVSVGTKTPGKFAKPAVISTTPTSSKINVQTDREMSQEMLEYIQALMEDEDAGGFS